MSELDLRVRAASSGKAAGPQQGGESPPISAASDGVPFLDFLQQAQEADLSRSGRDRPLAAHLSLTEEPPTVGSIGQSQGWTQPLPAVGSEFARPRLPESPQLVLPTQSAAARWAGLQPFPDPTAPFVAPVQTEAERPANCPSLKASARSSKAVRKASPTKTSAQPQELPADPPVGLPMPVPATPEGSAAASQQPFAGEPGTPMVGRTRPSRSVGSWPAPAVSESLTTGQPTAENSPALTGESQQDQAEARKQPPSGESVLDQVAFLIRPSGGELVTGGKMPGPADPLAAQGACDDSSPTPQNLSGTVLARAASEYLPSASGLSIGAQTRSGQTAAQKLTASQAAQNSFPVRGTRSDQAASESSPPASGPALDLPQSLSKLALAQNPAAENPPEASGLALSVPQSPSVLDRASVQRPTAGETAQNSFPVHGSRSDETASENPPLTYGLLLGVPENLSPAVPAAQKPRAGETGQNSYPVHLAWSDQAAPESPPASGLSLGVSPNLGFRTAIQKPTAGETARNSLPADRVAPGNWLQTRGLSSGLPENLSATELARATVQKQTADETAQNAPPDRGAESDQAFDNPLISLAALKNLSGAVLARATSQHPLPINGAEPAIEAQPGAGQGAAQKLVANAAGPSEARPGSGRDGGRAGLDPTSFESLGGAALPSTAGTRTGSENQPVVVPEKLAPDRWLADPANHLPTAVGRLDVPRSPAEFAPPPNGSRQQTPKGSGSDSVISPARGAAVAEKQAHADSAGFLEETTRAGRAAAESGVNARWQSPPPVDEVNAHPTSNLSAPVESDSQAGENRSSEGDSQPSDPGPSTPPGTPKSEPNRPALTAEAPEGGRPPSSGYLDPQQQFLVRRYQTRQLVPSARELVVKVDSERLGPITAQLEVGSDGNYTAQLQMRDPQAEQRMVRQLQKIQDSPLIDGHNLAAFTTTLLHQGHEHGQRSKYPTRRVGKAVTTPKLSQELPILPSSQVRRDPNGVNIRA